MEARPPLELVDDFRRPKLRHRGGTACPAPDSGRESPQLVGNLIRLAEEDLGISASPRSRSGWKEHIGKPDSGSEAYALPSERSRISITWGGIAASSLFLEDKTPDHGARNLQRNCRASLPRHIPTRTRHHGLLVVEKTCLRPPNIKTSSWGVLRCGAQRRGCRSRISHSRSAAKPIATKHVLTSPWSASPCRPLIAKPRIDARVSLLPRDFSLLRRAARTPRP